MYVPSSFLSGVVQSLPSALPLAMSSPTLSPNAAECTDKPLQCCCKRHETVRTLIVVVTARGLVALVVTSEWLLIARLPLENGCADKGHCGEYEESEGEAHIGVWAVERRRS